MSQNVERAMVDMISEEMAADILYEGQIAANKLGVPFLAGTDKYYSPDSFYRALCLILDYLESERDAD